MPGHFGHFHLDVLSLMRLYDMTRGAIEYKSSLNMTLALQRWQTSHVRWQPSLADLLSTFQWPWHRMKNDTPGTSRMATGHRRLLSNFFNTTYLVKRTA